MAPAKLPKRLGMIPFRIITWAVQPMYAVPQKNVHSFSIHS
ncbi:hypothetical protein [Mesobacillus persicus]|nr:hypothetical protein [Mesobacillus persicus]